MILSEAFFGLQKNVVHQQDIQTKQQKTRWWQLKYFLMFTPKIWEDEPILTCAYFQIR